MKLLFVVYRELTKGVGITKKIQAQSRAFAKNGYTVNLHSYKRLENGEFTSYIDEQEYENYGKGKLVIRIKTILNRKNIVKYVIKNQIQVVYIRYEFMADYAFLYFLKLLKKAGVIVVLEIPTFPYDHELKPKSLLSRIYCLMEKKCREKMNKYVDRVITYSDDKFIFKIPTIRISNGIDFEEIPLSTRNKVIDKIVFIGVANLGFWHGYDRLIYGIKDHIDGGHPITVHFNIIGNGDVAYRNSLIDLVGKLCLTSYVSFYENTEGEKLNDLFESSHLAIGSLGRHRSGITNLKSLKNVEYAARGIPFIYSEHDANFDDKDYILRVPANDSPINVGELVVFYASIQMQSVDIRDSIEGLLSWKAQIQEVVRSIGGVNNNKK